MLINKIISIVFRLIFLTLIITNYLHFMLYTWIPIAKTHTTAYIPIFIMNFLIIMLLWCIFVTIKSEPGSVPLYWGFYFGDSDIKRKRYCLMCNVFKPDRCHHCSVCNKCVLNMDHHCPWINNCIGFYNRKFFIQMLFYINITLIFMNVTNAKFIYDIIQKIIKNRVNIQKELTENIYFLILFILDVLLMFFLGNFFKFHLKLVLGNKTTIETIDKKGQEYESFYSIGARNNWKQVMGNSKLLWFFPLKIYIGAPEGNGIDWTETYIDEKKLNMMNSNYQSHYNSNNNFNSKYTGKQNIELVNSNTVDSLYKNNVSNFAKNSQPNNISDSDNRSNILKIINNQTIEQNEINNKKTKNNNSTNFSSSGNSFGNNNPYHFSIKEKTKESTSAEESSARDNSSYRDNNTLQKNINEIIANKNKVIRADVNNNHNPIPIQTKQIKNPVKE